MFFIYIYLKVFAQLKSLFYIDLIFKDFLKRKEKCKNDLTLCLKWYCGTVEWASPNFYSYLNGEQYTY